jgi:hypothetical protein
MTHKLKLETLENPKAKLNPTLQRSKKRLNFSTKQIYMVLRWVVKIMKREKQNTYNRKTARERGVLRWVAVGGSWWPALRRPKREMGSSRRSVDGKDK